MIIFGIIIAILCVGIGYLTFSPQLGGKSEKFNTENYNNGKFQNLVPTPMSSSNESVIKSIYKFFTTKSKEAYPDHILDTAKLDLSKDLNEDDVEVTWFGHSSVLIRTREINILIDPVFNEKRLPLLYLGPKRFPYKYSYKLEDLPKIDIVLISHDHYDHLDMGTVKKLSGVKFFVPLGIKSHLIKWGVKNDQIKEFNWYIKQETSEDSSFTMAPARHFSGRGLFYRDSTLWGSWIIELKGKKIFYSGDSGYLEEFKKIGEEYGPFDIAMLDNGQYNSAWQNIHMLPEEVVKASIDLKAKNLLPIHWGKYVLALHSWYEPIERVITTANKKGVLVGTPKIGESFLLQKIYPKDKWWK